MKRHWASLIIFLATFIFASPVYAEFDIQKLAKELPADVFKEVSRIPPQPHFLLGLEPKTDEWEQFLEWRKIFQTKDLFYASRDLGIMDKSRDDYRAAGNTELSELVQVAGKDIRILYPQHHFTKDGLYVFWSRMGEKNLAAFSPLYRKYEVQWGLGKVSDTDWRKIQMVLGWAQFEAVKSFVHGAIKWGLNKNLKDYGEMNLTSGVLEAREKLLDDPSYGQRLDEEVPGTPGLKIRDILPVPLTRAEDFLPDLIIVGPYGFYGGFANWKTPGTERIVFYDLLGLALWYVSGWQVPAHELVHTNPYLQGTPLSFYYDIEMWADLTTGLDSGMLEYLYHPYTAVVRDLARTYFGYDYEEVTRQIFPGEFGTHDIREKEFREHSKRIRDIRNELLRFIKDPKDGLMVRFYSDPFLWIAINYKFCDTAAAYRILFAMRYEPAGIFDPDRKDKQGNAIPPAIQTKEWLIKEDEAGRLKQLAQKAMEKTGTKTELGKEMAKVQDVGGLIKCPVNSGWFMASEKEQQKALRILKPLIERAKNGDSEARLILVRIFSGSGVLMRVPLH